jgi:tRNA 2-thiocytidine biosynthesis protein TtcA
LGGLEKEYPHLKESLLSAMGNIETARLLDPRYLPLDEPEGRVEDLAEPTDLLPILQ